MHSNRTFANTLILVKHTVVHTSSRLKATLVFIWNQLDENSVKLWAIKSRQFAEKQKLKRAAGIYRIR